MLAVLAAALALAGAPASTSVVCNPALPETVDLGIAFSSSVQVLPDGTIVLGRLDHISLGTTACGALLNASATTTEREQIRALNPGINFDDRLGLGLEVALHEANHVALNSSNECLVEKTTRSEIDKLLEQYADSGHVAQVESAATAADAALPPQYHGC